MNILTNKQCTIEYNKAEKKINGIDHTDVYNDPAFYSKSKRGLDKAWDLLSATFDERSTMSRCINVLWSAKITCHSYCRMD